MSRKATPVRKRSLGGPEPDDLGASTPAERMGMVWLLTLQSWAFKDGRTDEPRLSRHVVRVVRRER